MAQLQGNKDFIINLSGRKTINPLVGKRNDVIEMSGNTHSSINLLGRYGLGFAPLATVLLMEDASSILMENNNPILMEEQIV